MAEKETLMLGRDMLSFVRQGGRWLVVYDQFTPEPGLV
jgi:hypothetical protein